MLLVNNPKSPQQQLIIELDAVTAQRNDPLRQSARRYDSCLLSKLFLNPVYHTVDAGRIAIERAALHTFNRILADQALWRIKADARKLV